MNPFQNKALELLANLSKEINTPYELVEEKIGDYVQFQISDFQVWFYEEGGADFTSTNYERRFEIYDYGNADLLLQNMIFCLKDGILNKEKYAVDPQKYPPAIFNNDNIKGFAIIFFSIVFWWIGAVSLPNMYSLRFPDKNTANYVILMLLLTPVFLITLFVGVSVIFSNLKVKKIIYALSFLTAIVFLIPAAKFFIKNRKCLENRDVWNYMTSICQKISVPAGWHLPTERELGGEWRNGNVDRYAKVRGDFDSDGSEDLASYLVSDDNKKYGIFIWWKSNQLEQPVEVTVEDDASWLEVMGIELEKKGKIKTACGKGYYNCDGEPTEVDLEGDGIVFFKYESAASSFYWDKKEKSFKKVWITD